MGISQPIIILKENNEMNYIDIPVVHLRMVKEKEVEYGGRKMDSPKKAADLIRPLLDGMDRECIIVCGLDSRMKPAFIQTVAVGALNVCAFSIPEIFKSAVLANAAAIILFHNHPSGEPEPSEEDIVMTMRIRSAGKLLGITLADHIILGDGEKYYSFSESEEYWGDEHVSK